MLIHLVIITSATPAPAFTLLLDMNDDVHAAVLEELVGAFADVFEICGGGGNDVDHAENAPLFGGMIVVVVVVVMVVGV